MNHWIKYQHTDPPTLPFYQPYYIDQRFRNQQLAEIRESFKMLNMVTVKQVIDSSPLKNGDSQLCCKDKENLMILKSKLHSSDVLTQLLTTVEEQ